MKFKTTWILVALCGALGAYWYFVDQPREQAATAAKEREGLLFPTFDPAGVTELRLEGKKGRILLRKGADDRWTALEPVEDIGDSGRVRTLLEDIKALRAEKDVAQPGNDLKPFGLDAPELTIKTGGQPVSFAVGAANPASDGRYLQVSGGPVKLVKSYALEGLLISPDELRSKAILASFPWDKLRTIAVSDSRGLLLKLTKAGAQWRLEAPTRLEVDPDAADRMVEKLRWGKIVSFVKDSPEVQESLARGLSVSLSAEGQAAPSVLRLAETDGTVTGQATDRKAAFTVDKAVFEAFRQKPSDLRRMKPVLVKTWSAEKLEISAADKSARYQKAEGAWRRGAAAVRGGEREALEQMLQTFEEQKAQGVVDSAGSDARYGFASPKATVRILDSQNPEQLLQIAEKGHTVYARAGKSGPVYVMPEEYLTRVLALLRLSQAAGAPESEPGGSAQAQKP